MIDELLAECLTEAALDEHKIKIGLLGAGARTLLEFGLFLLARRCVWYSGIPSIEKNEHDEVTRL
jgi:hypothetical protein